MDFKYTAVLSALLLTACAQAPKREVEPPAPPVEKIVKEEPQPTLPNQDLTAPMLYEFMLSELASQRGHNDLAAATSYDLAKKTRDPRLAKRAAQLTFGTGQMDKALEAFRLWQELEPDSPLAQRMFVTLLVSGGRLSEAQPHIADMLVKDKPNAGRTLMQLYPMLAPYPDKTMVLDLLRDLTQPYPELPEAHYLIAQAANAKSERALALDEIRVARKLRPDWEAAVIFEALLLREQPSEAAAKLKEFLATHPDARDVRLNYARTLYEQKKWVESRIEFQKVLDNEPGNSELAFVVADISMRLGELDKAEAQLKQALEKGNKDENTLHFYLGQLNEAQQHDAEALGDYRAVKAGESLYPAQLRIAFLLNKSGKLDEAREQLHQIQPINNQQRVTVVLFEAQLLRDAQQYEATYQVLNKGLEKLPKHPDLLYETAMVADKLGKYAESEQLLRKLIQIKPDHAHAYNALGYSMLERNERIDEAVSLVEKALQIDPNDPAILDSAGWGYFRQGDLNKSLSFLRRAYAATPDPEVAGHLGEVLWMNGDKAEAEKIWDESLKANPGNAQLEATIKRVKHL
ncbi:Beta-barrel assembly-enhancing protease [Ferriphaselus amnicola]|uniref:Beta-barrel assembly-enhancing protease n=1 Tax=Ferriphaselus amnicola TaxID=1188319 RepID=A0A2Z6GAR5_9PROT|nr:tetratricopeptide repeat protein [Ferriphaselus amnicola]BBE50588.1 Beta-barrel assembly-enhancing protease [Ferriphaselus amnicola]